MMKSNLKKIRLLIDKLDKDIVKKLNERGELAQKIKEAKNLSVNKDIFRPEREIQILRKIKDINDGPLLDSHLQSIFREIMSSCLSLEIELKVACLGPELSYSDIALNKFFGSSTNVIFHNSISEIFDDVNRQNVDYGIVPIENSNQGSVKDTLDHLIKDDISISGETNLIIEHCLLSKSKKINQIKKIYAHEQSFLQCNDWITKNLPYASRIYVSSNSAAAKKIQTLKNSAAIASKNCSTLYKLPVLQKNIHDVIDNTTRFIIIGNKSVSSSGKDKTSILITINNKAGSLSKLLEPLSKSGISMTKIESIPTKINNWEYMFLIDIEGHIDNKKVSNALNLIRKKSVFFKHLGSYPKSI